MTYYGGKELAAAFRTVRKNTVQIAEDIPEEKYGFRPAPDSRTVAQTLAHIALAPDFQHHVHGNKIDDLMKIDWPDVIQKHNAEEARPRAKAEIVAMLKADGEKFASYVESLPEAFLAERVKMPPGADQPTKSRFEMLMSVKEHEMHHRGQLMTIERMIGVMPHPTRQQQERIARMQAAAPQAR